MEDWSGLRATDQLGISYLTNFCKFLNFLRNFSFLGLIPSCMWVIVVALVIYHLTILQMFILELKLAVCRWWLCCTSQVKSFPQSLEVFGHMLNQPSFFTELKNASHDPTLSSSVSLLKRVFFILVQRQFHFLLPKQNRLSVIFPPAIAHVRFALNFFHSGCGLHPWHFKY